MNAVPAELTGLIGVLIGGVITFLVGSLLKNREVQLKIVEKIIDKRIAAHEAILQISQQLRSTVSKGKIDSKGEAITYPVIFHSSEHFNNFRGLCYDVINPNTHWIGIELYRELNYLSDYIESMNIQLEDIPDCKYPDIGLIVKQDLISISYLIYDKATIFLSHEIFTIKIQPAKGHHKLPQSETISRFNKTELSKHRDSIKSMKS